MSRSTPTSGFEREALLHRPLSHGGVGQFGSGFGINPSLNIAPAPTHPTTVELELFWESADQCQRLQNPAVASRQPSDIVRREKLIPRRQAFIHPPRDRNGGSRRIRRT